MDDPSLSSRVREISWPDLVRYSIGGIFGFLISVFVMHLLVQLGEGKHSNATSLHLTSWMDTKRSIAAKKNSPKLIILGGSNAFYGLRAEQLSDNLGCPVVNFATHAALPSAYHFHELNQFVDEGDAVLYVPEYEKYGEDRYEHNSENVSFLISYSQNYLESLPLEDSLKMLFSLRANDYFGHLFRKAPPTEKRLNRVHRRHKKVISRHGDYLANRVSDITPEVEENRKNIQPVELRGVGESDFYATETAGDFIKMIISEHERLENRGIALMFSWPNTLDAPEHHSEKLRVNFEKITELLRSHGIEVVGDPYAAMHPIEDFFDSPYHLTDGSAQRRTARLLPSLRNALSEIDFPMDRTGKNDRKGR